MRSLLNISITIYIFLLFNREFVPFIDLRFIIFPIFLLLVLYKLFSFFMSGELLIFGKKKYIILVGLFVSIIILSNIKWFFNPYSPNEDVLLKVVLLYIYNLLAIFVVALYWKKINLKIFAWSIIFSGFVLFLSIIAQFLGIENLPFKGEVRKVLMTDFSIFGVRIGGYAEDPNYATFSMIIWFLISSLFFKNRFLIFLLFVCSLIGVLLSFSKTIILATFFILSILIAKKMKILVPYVISLIMLLVLLVLYILDIFEALSTMSIRFLMWKVALNSFSHNMILGSGITSVRSNFLYNGGWYVQPHNSFIALMHDSGIFALILYLSIFYLLFSKIDETKYKILLGLLFFFSFTYELLVLQYPYFTLGILPIVILILQRKIYITKIKG